MGERTNIGWTDHTWSPWWGCAKVSPACDHCYAEALDRRTGGAHWGANAPRKFLSENHWRQPLKWNAAVPEGETRFVFPSMCDPFDNHDAVTRERDRFWQLMIETPRLTWLLLTKRVGNVERLTRDQGLHWPVNAALGATVVTQAEAERDVPKLLAVQGPRFRFVSIEPMLEPVTLHNPGAWSFLSGWDYEYGADGNPRLDWVICGGESGPHARAMKAEWARSLRDQCAQERVSFFFKQWGGRTPTAGGKALDGREHCERPSKESAA